MTIVNQVAAHGVIKKGDRGAHVLELQHTLAALGHSLRPDSAFGPITQMAVEALQKRVGLEPDGVVGVLTAREIDRMAALPPQPQTERDLIYCDFMYGLGDRSTSAGMDVLARGIAALSPRLVIAPTLSWSQRDMVASKIRARGAKARNILCGNSMGANAIPMVTNAVPHCHFDLVAGYDPTIWWSCPAFVGMNVQDVINYHGINWLNPIGHARYTPGFDGQVETVKTATLHSRIDDDVALHRHTFQRVREKLALAA